MKKLEVIKLKYDKFLDKLAGILNKFIREESIPEELSTGRMFFLNKR